ncbi:hypothetical protein DOTSEDRAFT_35398 [Dothistroma septosporum NZE10]|uniref:Uncharacterized protein n=1 Tax=Dothistroma septosporum (strain NZE10 / CBS 128990) TaxID=675120 RepID=M2Y439_DOTSN|nr:hypothetical protein DOTSEDRAFT_35398 [Dothistroma septosporum NZE10]
MAMVVHVTLVDEANQWARSLLGPASEAQVAVRVTAQRAPRERDFYFSDFKRRATFSPTTVFTLPRPHANDRLVSTKLDTAPRVRRIKLAAAIGKRAHDRDTSQLRQSAHEATLQAGEYHRHSLQPSHFLLRPAP